MNKSELLVLSKLVSITTPGSNYNREEMENIVQALTIVRLICMMIYPPIICFFGIVANVLNIIVLTRRWMASSTNVYLTAVAIGDMLYLTLFYAYSLYIYIPMRSVGWYNQLFPYIRSTANVCSNTTTWLTVTFTVERYIAVCHPMLRHKICTNERAKWIVGIVCFSCFALTVPDYLMYKVIPPNRDNATIYNHDKSHLAVILSKYGYSYLNQLLFIVIPLILLIIFNTLLVRSVIKANKFRKGMMQATIEVSSKSSSASGTPRTQRKQRPNSEQQRITLMLIVVVITFIVFQLPSTVSMIVDSLQTTDKIRLTPVNEKKILIFGNFVNIFLLTSAALNFVLYSLFSAKFRETFLRLFPCCSKNVRGRTLVANGSTFGCDSLPLSTITSPRNNHRVPITQQPNSLIRGKQQERQQNNCCIKQHQEPRRPLRSSLKRMQSSDSSQGKHGHHVVIEEDTWNSSSLELEQSVNLIHSRNNSYRHSGNQRAADLTADY